MNSFQSKIRHTTYLKKKKNSGTHYEKIVLIFLQEDNLHQKLLEIVFIHKYNIEKKIRSNSKAKKIFHNL